MLQLVFAVDQALQVHDIFPSRAFPVHDAAALKPGPDDFHHRAERSSALKAVSSVLGAAKRPIAAERDRDVKRLLRATEVCGHIELF